MAQRRKIQEEGKNDLCREEQERLERTKKGKVERQNINRRANSPKVQRKKLNNSKERRKGPNV